MTVAIVFKVALFFLLLSRFKLRARTTSLATLSLANYSEFGLLVATIGVRNNWIGPEWLITIAIALSISFILASPLNLAAHRLYERWSKHLQPCETKSRHPDDQPLDPGDAEIAVFGIGRIGAAAYDDMRERYSEIVIGIDFNFEVVEKHRQAGAHAAYDIYAQAGFGFAEHVSQALGDETEGS